MAQIRPAIVQEFTKELSKSVFGSVSFDIDLPEAGPLIKITFCPKRDFVLEVMRTTLSERPLRLEVAPGEYQISDVVHCRNIQECVNLIQPWTERIREDLRTIEPNLCSVKDFRDALAAHMSANMVDSDSRFSGQEIEALAERLAEFETRLTEMEVKQELTQTEVFELRSTIRNARADLPQMSRGVWYQTAGGKLWEVMGKVASSPHAHQLVADLTRRLIGM